MQEVLRMRIELKKFGRTLTSRPAGKEAFAGIQATLNPDEKIVEVDFDGILTLSPSWADEFFSALQEMYGERLVYLASDNPSVAMTLKILRESKEAAESR